MNLRPVKCWFLISIVALSCVFIERLSIQELNAQQRQRADVFLMTTKFIDDDHLLVGGDSIRIFDLSKAKANKLYSNRRWVRAVDYSPTQNLWSGGGDAQSVSVSHHDDLDRARTMAVHEVMITGVAFDPNGALLASVGTRWKKGVADKGELRVWDVKAGNEVHSMDLTAEGISCASYSPDGTLLAIAIQPADPQKPSRIEIYDVDSWKRVDFAELPNGFAINIRFVMDNDHLIVTGGECLPLSEDSCRPTGRIWHLDLMSMTDSVRQIDVGNGSYFRGLDVDRATNQYVTCCSNGGAAEVRLRRMADGQLVWRKSIGRAHEPHGVSISPDTTKIAVVARDKIHILNFADGTIEDSYTVQP